MRSRHSLFAFKGLVPALSSHVPNFQRMNHMVEERKWPGRRCRAIRSEAHTQRLMEGGVTFTCLRPGSIIVESGRAPITTREGNEIQLDGHAFRERFFPQKAGSVSQKTLNKASRKSFFPLPHIDVLVDNTAGHGMLSFMDAFS